MDRQAQLLDRLESVVDELVGLSLAEPPSFGTSAAAAAQRLKITAERVAGLRLVELSAVVESGAWGLDGSRSPKAWLVRSSGSSMARAGSDLKLARHLAGPLPGTRRAVLEGTCPIEHARALSTHATDTDLRLQRLADSECGETFLLSRSHLRADQFTTLVRTWAMRVDPDAADAKHRADRDLNELYVSPTTGGGDIRGWLSPEVTEGLRAALRAEIGTPAKDDHRTAGQRNHDAMGSIVNRILTSGELGRSAQVRPSLVVQVPFDSLVQRASRVGAVKELDPAILQGSREPLPRSVLDKLACDSEVMRVVFGPQSQVIDLGQTQRLFTGALRRALDARDGGCRRPGCDAPPWLCEGHHIDSWLDGGPTSLDNGVLACWADHDWIHRDDISLVNDIDGGLRFLDRDGRDFGISYPRGPTTLSA